MKGFIARSDRSTGTKSARTSRKTFVRPITRTPSRSSFMPSEPRSPGSFPARDLPTDTDFDRETARVRFERNGEARARRVPPRRSVFSLRYRRRTHLDLVAVFVQDPLRMSRNQI